MTDQSAMQQLTEAKASFDQLRAEIHKVIVGQNDVVDQILLCMLCRSHGLLVGVPGLAKTLLISTIARTLSMSFARIQFTPDLMPSDITGTEMIQEDKTTGSRSLQFVRGPIFANVVLADEINRTPPKTQAALLEAMQERHVTIGGQQHMLPDPFFVLATQNPIEQEGTYPLPEAQLDRFMFQIHIGYPTAEEEAEIVRRSAMRESIEITKIIDAEKLARIQKLVQQCPVPDHVISYALRLVRATRINEPQDGDMPRPEMAREYLSWGAGPRASEALISAAKACAVVDGTGQVTTEHVRKVARPVLRHRIMPNYSADADQITSDMIIDAMLKDIPTDGMSARDRKNMDLVVG
ncbi:MAG: MoxR family ATPase [Phycisphaeraceae bacterium]|nr:MoxR family ATPase [Phycisphaerales bacterium]MCB9859434.1 MoxR family ATPase [Phycisphaeraceae bacterium]